MARVPLLDAEDLPEEYRYLFTENDVGEADIFRAMANAPEQMQSYMRYSTTIWGVLPDREREVVILAAARALDHEYEWHQHVRIGRAVGVADEAIRAIGARDLDALDDRDRALAEYAGAVVLDEVTDPVHARMTEHFDDETVVGVAMLASHYVATGRTLDALGVEPEEEFVGWEP
ncbi:MAG: carboxymuconolactone decarboxylase family protein [Haloarculaceae archaeon]